jgi:hypothetical protein
MFIIACLQEKISYLFSINPMYFQQKTSRGYRASHLSYQSHLSEGSSNF